MSEGAEKHQIVSKSLLEILPGSNAIRIRDDTFGTSDCFRNVVWQKLCCKEEKKSVF